jgi:hypothetical protein
MAKCPIRVVKKEMEYLLPAGSYTHIATLEYIGGLIFHRQNAIFE